jgi:hypothetical protein
MVILFRGNRSILFMPLRVAAILMPLRVAAILMPLRVAAARNRSDWFPAPSCGQALRPAPVMDVGGCPRLVGHASAASDEGLLGHSALCRYLFVCSFVRLPSWF